jgi:hypothetical protein
MRGTFKSGLSLLLSGIVLGSTFLTGCKKEQAPTKQDNIKMWTKLDGGAESTQTREEEIPKENTKSSTTPVFYMAAERYRDKITTEVFGEKVTIDLMYISQRDPRENNMDEITFTMNIGSERESNSKLRFLPQGKYFVSSQKLDQIETQDLRLKRVNTLETGDPEYVKIVNRDPQTEIKFKITESGIYAINSLEEAKIKENRAELTAEEFSSSLQHTILLRQKKAPNMNEISAAMIIDYEVINEEGIETNQLVCMQTRINPPFFPEYEGYWLDETTREIFCLSRKEILKTNTLRIRDTSRNPNYHYFNRTAMLEGNSIIRLDPTKTKDSLEFRNGNVTYTQDKKKRELKKISEEEAYRY